MALSQQLRREAQAIFQAGVTAADPYQAVLNHLDANGPWPKVHVVAFGKAACAMMKAALVCIPAESVVTAIAVTNDENVTALANAVVLSAGHPLPDESGLQAARRIAAIASQAQEDELVLVLISGGGSALLPYPVAGVSLADKIATTQILLASGAAINEINCVRKHLSELKGGGLAKLAYPAKVHALILSDVLGDDFSAIASGPTVPDPTTFVDAIAILKNHQVWEITPASVQAHLLAGLAGDVGETPKPGDAIFTNVTEQLIGSNALSVHAMLASAKILGYTAQLYSAHLCGEAREAAKLWVATAKTLSEPSAMVAGGETTVTLRGTGKGGRNQELALAFALEAKQQGLGGTWAFLSGGTDGRDGPTDAAGGLVDSGSILRMVEAGCDPKALLANNDSYHALECSEDLLKTGATGTNVADLQVLLFTPQYYDGN